MIALIQRVSEAKVVVNNKNIAEIQQGVLAFIGIEKDDSTIQASRLVDKILSYRIFADKEGPQFTLAADTQKGCRPGFSSAAAPELGEKLFNEFIKQAKNKYQYIETGQFGEDMKVSLLNDGPVTFWLQANK